MTDYKQEFNLILDQIKSNTGLNRKDIINLMEQITTNELKYFEDQFKKLLYELGFEDIEYSKDLVYYLEDDKSKYLLVDHLFDLSIWDCGEHVHLKELNVNRPYEDIITIKTLIQILN